VGEAGTFWSVVVAIELADLAFSLDNVVAAVALSSDLRIVLLGVAIGIVTMRFAAGIFGWLIEREPVLHRAAYLLVFVIAIEVLLDELAHIHISHLQRFIISSSIIGVSVAYRHVPLLQLLQPVFRAGGVLCYYADVTIGWLLWPLHVVLQGLQWVTRTVALPMLRSLLAAALFLRSAWWLMAEAIMQRLGGSGTVAQGGHRATRADDTAPVDRSGEAEAERAEAERVELASGRER
jgi:hypothetical protein